MNSNTKRSIIIISVNTAVMLLWFLIKYVLIPRAVSAEELRGLGWGSDLDMFLFWVPIPVISIVGMIIEQHLRYWIIPDLVYCTATYLYSAVDHTYGIGNVGLFFKFQYKQSFALFECFFAFVIILLLQLVFKLIIMLVKKIWSKIANSRNTV